MRLEGRGKLKQQPSSQTSVSGTRKEGLFNLIFRLEATLLSIRFYDYSAWKITAWRNSLEELCCSRSSVTDLPLRQVGFQLLSRAKIEMRSR